MRKQVHIIITGVVQNVGYRKFVRKWAKELGLTGWTRNLNDGTVEVLAVGDEDHLTILVEKCTAGPFLAQVDNVDAQWDEVQEEFPEFAIRH